MSPPLLGVEEGGKLNHPLSNKSRPRREHNYFGMSDCSSVESSSENRNNNLNLKATELRLGLPGSQSPQRDSEHELSLLNSSNLDEKPLFPLTPLKDGICSLSQKAAVLGSKRGFSDTVEDNDVMEKNPVEGNWMFSEVPKQASQGKHPMNSGHKSFAAKEQPVGSKDPPKASQESPCSNNNNNAPASKAQVVGWPPIRSFRKNSLATTSKSSDPIFVKVSMDGAPYLRKLDLRTHNTYKELSDGLEKMFSCFTLGQCGLHGASGRETVSETKWKDLLNGSEYVLTYEDKDGDWMLVGDVPWEMFIDSCKRLKIMKSSDAIGLAPRAAEKSKSLK